MNPKYARLTQRCFSLLTLLAMFLSACQVTPSPAPPDTTAGPPPSTAARPTDRRPTAALEPTTTPPPSPVPPTATPAVSPTPVDIANLPMPAPRLLYFSPSWGQEQPLDAPITLTFDQPMDRARTEAAFSISPTVAGTFSWPDDHTLAYTPRQPLQRDRDYRVELAATARSSAGEPLEEGVYFEFNAVGYLAVSEVEPAGGAAEIDPNTVVTVVFNRPVVPVTGVGGREALPQPLVLDPPVPGKGEWLSTSIYVFHPEQGLIPSTRYTATVAAGLQDTLGALLEHDYRWVFTTVRPSVLGYTPPSGAACIYPEQVISVTFSQPMIHASAEACFSLLAGREPVAGSFRWKGGETPSGPETMVFVPTDPLARKMTYVATLRAGARPRAGAATLERAVSWRFTTIGAPGLNSIRHTEGATVEANFASPMKREGFLDAVRIVPSVAMTDVLVYWEGCDNVARVHFRAEPATTYTVTVSADAQDYSGHPTGKAGRVTFTTPDVPAYAYLNTSGLTGVFSAYTDTLVYAACRNVPRLDLGLHKVSPEDLMLLLGYGNRYVRDYTPKPENLIKTWTVVLQPARNKDRLVRIDLSDAQGQRLPPGLYLLRLGAPGVQQPSFFLFSRSRINLTVKQAPHQTLIWATDLETGRPVPELELRLFAGTTVPTATGTTDEQGLFRSNVVGREGVERAFFAVAGQPGDEDFSIAFDDWGGGIAPYDFGASFDYDPNGYRGYLYTERPIYRPGQTVYFKGIVRYNDDASYSIPPLATVPVRIVDPDGKQVFNQSLPLGDMGTVYGELPLAGEAALGSYHIYMGGAEYWDSYAYTSFRVAEYKKPEYQVDVTPARPAYAAGETITADTVATYYFGGPVADAAVHWSVLSRDYYFTYRCPKERRCPWYSWTADDPWYDAWDYWSDYGNRENNRNGRLIAEGDAKTDEQGRVTYGVPGDISAETQSQVLTLESSVTDLSGQQVSNRTAVIVHKGDFYIGVAPRGYLARSGKEKQVDLLVVDWDSQPVKGVRLTVGFAEREWYSVRRQEDDGNYYWTWTAKDTPVLTTTVTTDAEGRAVATLTPETSGMYHVRVIGRDGRENEVRSSGYFWVWGGRRQAHWRRESNNRIDLVADKREYEVGDTAEILVPSPYTGTVYALVTIERGHIIETSVRQFTSTSEVLRVPILPEYVPNVYVSVILMQGSAAAPDGISSFKMGLVNLPISNKVKELQVTLTPDRSMEEGEHYGPRETATYDILVTDSAGNPVEAEFSLRMADLAVLALANEAAPPLLDYFWYGRGIAVRTSMPLVVAMEPYNQEIKPGAKGGGGGDEGGDGGLVRTRFADTAYWAPAVHTGADGRATVTVELPDNLTTWRMQAIGLTADTRVGRTDVDVLTTLDVLVRAVLPRFFVTGDKARLGTIVHNNTPHALDVRVELAVEGLVLNGPSAVTVTVASGAQTRLNWPVTVRGVEQVRVKMTARSGSYFDGREDTLPVYRYTTPDVVATAGRLGEAGARLELIQLPPRVQSAEGELRVQVNGSLTGATRDALSYLEHYPYECVEQTTSRFLPNVFTYQVLKEMGLSNVDLEKNLTRLVGVALQRLYNFQHYDNGWGWWTNDASNLYLSTYVLQGMLEAARAGFTVDRSVMDKGASYLHSNMLRVSASAEHWQANRQAYVLYVLAEYYSAYQPKMLGSLQSPAVGLFEQRQLLDVYGQATLAVALGLIEPQEPSRVATLLTDLVGHAKTSAAGAHWQEGWPDYWNMNTDVRTTAIVVWALSRLKPDSSVLPGAVRWLMAVRQEGYWESTNTTAWALLALVTYMRASGEMQGDYSYSIFLNGEVLGSADVTQSNLEETSTVRVEIARLLVEETNRLVIQRHPAREGQSGLGQLYYTAYLRYFLPVEEARAINRGIVVSREYTLVDRPDETVQSAKVGDLVRVRLTLMAPRSLYYLVVEDPLPAGCEGVDASLKTTSVVGERPRLQNVTTAETNRWYRYYGWGWWWFAHTEMRDEKVVLFATYLQQGTYEYTYTMRASVPGEFLVLPAHAYQMYFPEVYGQSAGGKFSVTGE